jgi:hypothetical protein
MRGTSILLSHNTQYMFYPVFQVLGVLIVSVFIPSSPSMGAKVLPAPQHLGFPHNAHMANNISSY